MRVEGAGSESASRHNSRLEALHLLWTKGSWAVMEQGLFSVSNFIERPLGSLAHTAGLRSVRHGACRFLLLGTLHTGLSQELGKREVREDEFSAFAVQIGGPRG
jgi:hypothetical protein